MGNILVAYFSGSGTTAALSKKLAEGIKADLFEIVPANPYSEADLDWQDSNSRSSIEMQDKSFRPEIINRISNMSDYEEIFLGFPIWWYREPSIIDTFLESYDMKGKKIIPFATSGGSDIDDAVISMQSVVNGAVVVKGKRFECNASADELIEWAYTWI